MKLPILYVAPTAKSWAYALGLATLIALWGLQAIASALTVSIDGVHAGTGSIRVALYANADSFRHEDRALRVLAVPANSNAVSVTFADIPAGRYAVLAYHDANDNKKMDLVMGMFPNEGWGLSNDPTVIGPPRFEPSAFDIGEATATTIVRLHY